MEVALLASMKIEVGFNQSPSMNGINVKIACRCYGKNLFKDPDDDSECFVSSFGTLEHVMLSLPMACKNLRLKSFVLYRIKMAMQGNSSGIHCFIHYQKKKKNLILITFDFALLTILSWILVLSMINKLYLQ